MDYFIINEVDTEKGKVHLTLVTESIKTDHYFDTDDFSKTFIVQKAHEELDTFVKVIQDKIKPKIEVPEDVKAIIGIESFVFEATEIPAPVEPPIVITP